VPSFALPHSEPPSGDDSAGLIRFRLDDPVKDLGTRGWRAALRMTTFCLGAWPRRAPFRIHGASVNLEVVLLEAGHDRYSDLDQWQFSTASWLPHALGAEISSVV
jgi:hypothetical protein